MVVGDKKYYLFLDGEIIDSSKSTIYEKEKIGAFPLAYLG